MAADVSSYSDTGLEACTTYTYRVRAYLASDGVYSSYSNVDGATTLSCSLVSVEIRVTASSDDAEERASGSMYLSSSDLELV